MERNSVVKIDDLGVMVFSAKNFWNSIDKRNRFFKSLKAVFAYKRWHIYKSNIKKVIALYKIKFLIL